MDIKSENIPKPVRDGGLFSVSDYLRGAGMQKMRALNQNGLLQEELDWQDIRYIADSLYMSEHIEHHKLEEILDKSQSRRKAVDSLVDAIIGNQSAVSAFLRILESENRFSYMAERIRSMEIASGVDLYKTVRSSFGFDCCFVDCSSFVERFDCSIDCSSFEPIGYCYCSNCSIEPKPIEPKPIEPKPKPIDCFDLIPIPSYWFEPKPKPSYWFEPIPIPSYWFATTCEYPTAQKCMKMQDFGSEAVKEKKMVKSLRIAIVGQKLWSHVSKHLDLEFKEAFKGPPEDEE